MQQELTRATSAPLNAQLNKEKNNYKSICEDIKKLEDKLENNAANLDQWGRIKLNNKITEAKINHNASYVSLGKAFDLSTGGAKDCGRSKRNFRT